MHARPNERYLERENHLAAAAAATRRAVAYPNRTATDDHTDRLADKGPEDLTSARAFATAFGLTR
jgi:hypothetical protein